MDEASEAATPFASGVVLAGGASRRMGRDKAWIEFEGRALIERVIAALTPVCQEIVVVANDRAAYEKLGVKLVGDVLPGKGALGGIYSGLSAAQCDYALAVACDLPFLNAALLRYLLRLAPAYDVVIPRVPAANPAPRAQGQAAPGELPSAKDANLHPLHAVYSKRCLAPMLARLRADELRLISFHADVHVRVVTETEIARYDPQFLSFLNTNTPEELAFAQTFL